MTGAGEHRGKANFARKTAKQQRRNKLSRALIPDIPDAILRRLPPPDHGGGIAHSRSFNIPIKVRKRLL